MRAVLFVFLVALCVCNEFDPGESSTFRHSSRQLSLSYADGSFLLGNIGTDDVSIGAFETRGDVGVVKIPPRSFSSFKTDGIVGFAFKYKDDEYPLFYSLVGDSPYDTIRGVNKSEFGVFYTAEKGELQLGGYVPESCLSTPTFVDVVKETVLGGSGFFHWTIDVKNLTYGDTPLFNYKQGQTQNPIQGVVDSGTSCLILPESTFENMFAKDPYTAWTDAMKGVTNVNQLKKFKLTIGDYVYEIDPRDYVVEIDKTKYICVASIKNSDYFIIGSPFYRSLLVVHNLEDVNVPKIGFCKLNRSYASGKFGKEVTESTKRYYKELERNLEVLPLTAKTHDAGVKHVLDRKVGVGDYLALGKRAVMGKLFEVGNSEGNTDLISVDAGLSWYVNVHIGSKQEQFSVIFDTGSSNLAVFAPQNNLLVIIYLAWQIVTLSAGILYVIMVTILMVSSIAFVFVIRKRRKQVTSELVLGEL